MNTPVRQTHVGTAADLQSEELRRLEWFSNYLDMPILDPERISNEDYAAVIGAAIDKYGVSLEGLCDRFAINKSTVSRWKNGKNAPQPFARPLIFDWIKADVGGRVERLRARVRGLAD